MQNRLFSNVLSNIIRVILNSINGRLIISYKVLLIGIFSNNVHIQHISPSINIIIK